ncbi:cation diffusion facilitator family transporter [Kordiimonas gwangyangensis]|uniref:cation diffusion facilitator family transporter n=1 Tax=Kordiimonas gwangyangensis TaxID=288022 RepID=UPI0003747633|nr:cation diffusion facilitator family transporter [Kordiimonas gwangyangensis]
MNREEAGKLMTWGTRASVAVAFTLVCTKAVAWWLSGSVAMLGSMADSTLDFMASLVTLFAVRLALVPPDDDHRFGHGKAEALAGLFQAAIMTGSAVFLTLESVTRLWEPELPTSGGLVIAVSALAIVLSLVLVAFQSYVIRRTRSIAVSGDQLHYKGDLLLNASVIASAIISGTGFLYADGIFGLLIAGYIFVGALGIVRPAIDMLMDREFDEDEREQIFNLVMENRDVLGMHGLKTRTSGRDRFIQMHIEVPGSMSIDAAHMIADEVEATLGEHFPDTEIIIHMDPPSPQSDALTVRELMREEDA